MTPMKKCAVVLAAGVALGLLSAKIALAADDAGRAPRGNDLWDAGAPLPGAMLGELALRQPDGFGPPGPPHDGDDDGPPPPRRERGPGMDRRQPPGSPPGDGDGPPPPRRERGPGMDRREPPGPPPGDGDRMPPPRRERGPEGDRPQPPGPPEFMKNKDPEMYKLLKEDMDLERQSREMAMEYRRAPKEQREKIKQQIEELVDKHFDVRQQRRTLELKHLEEELQRLRDVVDRRVKSRKEAVGKRVSELIGSEDDMRF